MGTKMTKKKIAVCISGEWRTGTIAWEKNFHKLNLQENEFVFFISTWKESYYSSREESINNLFLKLFLKRTIDNPEPFQISEFDIRQVFISYGNIVIDVEDNHTWENIKIDIPYVPEGRLGRKVLGSLRMFYKIKRADDLRKEYENMYGFTFDQVIRIRPDSILDVDPIEIFEQANCDLLFFSDPNEKVFEWGPVNDQLFIANSKVMTLVTSAFDNLLVHSKEVKSWGLSNNSIHEVLVAESALSWHVKELRKKFRVVSVTSESKLLRPPIRLRKMNRNEIDLFNKYKINLFKHQLKKLLIK